MLQVSNLTIAFGNKTVLDQVSFDLPSNQILGIVGESGSGKSLTSYAITGLLPKNATIQSGSIVYDGIDLLQQTPKQLGAIRGKKIAMIFQEPMSSLNPSMTCGKQVLETILLHTSLNKKEAKERVIQLFEQVKLPNAERIFSSYPHEISGGQKQRVMIAIAISCNPDILIADEPTTALDVTVQKEILLLLKSIQKETQMSILFISHDLGVINEICDEVMVMYRGKILEKNKVQTIFSQADNPYTKGLIASKVTMNHRMKTLPTVNDFTENNDFQPEYETAEERATYQAKIYAKEPLLVVKNLKKYYPKAKDLFQKQTYFKAVDGVDFAIYPGETVGLVGESGCGKTTLSRTLLQLQKATEGEIFYKGKDLCTMNQEELRKIRREIQIIFQDPFSSLNPRKTIGEIIIEPMRVHKIGKSEAERKKIAQEILQKVGLDGSQMNRYPHEFSGGQRQRIGIARVLVLKPEFIICDESVSALDVSVQAQVLNLLNELKHEFGFTYLFISHDLSVVKYMSNQLLVMNKGVFEEQGDADTIYQHPNKVYTKNLIDAIPKIN